MAMLDKISIRGFKSIEKLENFELKSLNVLIGANGAGKSNFVDFFRLLRSMVDEGLQSYVNIHSPSNSPDGYFFNGVSFTKKIESSLEFGMNRYLFTLVPTAAGKHLYITSEITEFTPTNTVYHINSGSFESTLKQRKNDPGVFSGTGINSYVYRSLSSWQVYHFHDTSMTAGMRRDVGVEQGASLLSDASNLAAFLLQLRDNHKENYDLLRKTIARIAPYFEDFALRITKGSTEDQVRLTWKKKGTDYVFSPGHFSDGTIRFICLAAVLLQPNPPTTIVIDEPELGLHPEALSILGGLLRSASSHMQIIVSTQSPMLVSEFEPDQIITVDQIDGASRFNRLDVAGLSQWLEEYSIGELWQKGTIAGGVNHA